MDSIGLVLFDSIKIRGGGGGVCAHRAGAVGYTLALESVWSKKEGRIGADIPRELTSTLPLAPFPSPSLSFLSFQLGPARLGIAFPSIVLRLLFPRSGISPAGSVIALSTAAFFSCRYTLLLLSSVKGMEQARSRILGHVLVPPRLVVSIERTSFVGYFARFMRRTPRT